jgi:hypothetical protein
MKKKLFDKTDVTRVDILNIPVENDIPRFRYGK